ncbi:unnamed protein product [Linum trigynum]|uniref:Uncharacterized protein n=1 Tax=Linum trigynum TaxID=586398 RepID=A0AAV2G9L6_9ROSI
MQNSWIVAYEKMLNPLAKRVTGEPLRLTIAKRILVGIVMSIAAMVVATNVERKKRDSAVRIGEFVFLQCFAILMSQFLLMEITDGFSFFACRR